MNCPKCNSKKYDFKKTKKGIVWKCEKCGYKKINKTAEQLLTEDPIKGALKRDLTIIETKFVNKGSKNKKSISAKEAVDYLKSKNKKLKIIKKKPGYYRVELDNEKQASIQDRKSWVSIYKRSNKFNVIKVFNEKEMEEALKDVL